MITSPARAGRLAAALAATAAVALGSPAAAARPGLQAAPAVQAADARAREELHAGVEAYVALHQKLEATLPPAPSDPTPRQLDTHQRALARLIQQSRTRARPGDVFTPAARAYIRRVLKEAVTGPDGPEIRGIILDENPGRVQLRVNWRYPDGVPLSTMPFQVLALLPPLPGELEYRFIGERLILLDVHAHLVVDYLDNALPR